MKRITLTLLVFLTTMACATAQTLPPWVYNTPRPGNDTYLYAVEYATGATELEARNQAMVRVYQTMALRLGVPLNAQAINDAVQTGKSVEVISATYNLPINKVCEYAMPVYGGGYRVYVLCQVARYGNTEPEWDIFSDCVDDRFIQQTEKRQKKWKSYSRNKSFYDNSQNNYIGWGLISTGYPWRFGTTINGRHGGIVGVGYYLSVGIDIIKQTVLPYNSEPITDESWIHYNSLYHRSSEREIPTYYHDHEAYGYYVPFHWAVGIKFFPYKTFYLSCGYGTIGGYNQLQDFAAVISTMDQYGYYDYMYSFDCYKRQLQNKGLILNIGADIVPNTQGENPQSVDFFMTVNAGVSYDFEHHRWDPSIGVQMGMEFRLNRKRTQNTEK